jgi:hypothetical protein
MQKFRITALAVLAATAVTVFAQTSSPVNQDQMTAADILANKHSNWTMKEQAALLIDEPFVRPNDMWEITHMFRMMPSNDERVIYDAVSNAIQDNAGDYYTRRTAEEAYWQNYYNNPSAVTTTVTTTPSGDTAVTTTTTTPTTVVTTPPVVVNTPPRAYAPTTTPYGDTTNIRNQGMVGAGMAVGTGMSEIAAWEFMQKDLDSADRTTFRRAWDNMTSGQQDALIHIVRQSSYYYTARSNGIYYYYNPY